MKLREYVEHDATGLASLVRAGDVTPSELTQLAREAHDDVNSRLNAVIEFYEDAETVSGADGGLFHGVPFLRKDIGATEAGRLQERGSRLYKGHRPDTESYFFCRARAAGLRTLGRTTTPELFGGSGMSESILNGITGNPWNLERSAGGSSSGAAAAVASGITPIAHGTDGGGSIRIPASWCGLVGLNPSRGRVSGGPNDQDRSFGLPRDFVLCRTVRDMAAALDVFAGPHPGDPFIIVQPHRTYVEELSQPTGTLRVGVAITAWGAAKVEPETQQAVERTAALLQEMGHTVTEMPPPFESAEYYRSRLRIGKLSTKLSADSLEEDARAMGRQIDSSTLEPFSLKLYEYGRQSQSASVGDALEALRSLRFRVGEAISSFDILLTPTLPTVALPHNCSLCPTSPTLSVEEFGEAARALYPYLGVFNVTGHPSVSLPLAQNAGGLPIGLQIVGRFGDEATLVRIARDLAEARPWHHRRPSIRAGAI
ncbi:MULTISPECIES: amidase [unclassified Bradyrhizobium]|uniref:amidase n=1 Tax=unclassified Bradyrhizobium TaxID=2631580 RepID=UPI001CD4A545|nr:MULTISPECIES: amidase [unclassified Bradyrhizobium]MCA1378612.1 amidase [Bradyrhizobium sp. IC4060]MCA1488435.1 amidase [Bradyrhizobium sp. IC4061]